jgi:threonyl-tRNA synthetase
MIQGEIKNCLEFMEYVYGKFGFQFSLELSTRPENFLGEIATWDKAERMIADALTAFGTPWKLNPGDGAFYGPKIGTHKNKKKYDFYTSNFLFFVFCFVFSLFV